MKRSCRYHASGSDKTGGWAAVGCLLSTLALKDAKHAPSQCARPVAAGQGLEPPDFVQQAAQYFAKLLWRVNIEQTRLERFHQRLQGIERLGG